MLYCCLVESCSQRLLNELALLLLLLPLPLLHVLPLPDRRMLFSILALTVLNPFESNQLPRCLLGMLLLPLLLQELLPPGELLVLGCYLC